MALYEHSDADADFIQWGLRILDVEPINDQGYYDGVNQYNVHDGYNEQHYQMHYDTTSNYVENDEIIARTLQEEYSQLDIRESPKYSHIEEENLHSSGSAYDWQNSSFQNYSSSEGHVGIPNEDTYNEHASSSSRRFDGEDYPFVATDEYALDDEVDKRMSQMIPIRHVPKINGEIPSTDEATSDHRRLLDRLQLYDFVEYTVNGDGNCQFRALSDQLYQSADNHKLVRRRVVEQLKLHQDIYEGYVPMEYGEYQAKMSMSGEWGDHVTLQAAADSYGVKIFLITSFKDTCCIEILPHFEKPKRVIFLSFWAEVHYNSIYPRGDQEIHTDKEASNDGEPDRDPFPDPSEDEETDEDRGPEDDQKTDEDEETESDVPSTDLKKKKSWWSFRNKQ